MDEGFSQEEQNEATNTEISEVSKRHTFMDMLIVQVLISFYLVDQHFY